MGFTDWIIKISNTKFARRLQYEPHIIKSVEYISPAKDDKVLVIYKETDYLQSLMMQYVKYKNYYSFEVKENINLEEKVDIVVLFFSVYDIDEGHMDTIKKYLKKSGYVYNITYLNDSKFFELTLKLIDKDESKRLKEEDDILENNGFILEDSSNFVKHHVSVKRYRVGD